ncbi:MAG: choice-of-anchor U domain-containing protein [Thermodesulfobacteriota bacterium]
MPCCIRRIGFAGIAALLVIGLTAGTARAADVAVQEVEIRPENPVAGQACNIRGQVENRGDERTDSFPVILTVNGTEQFRHTIVHLQPETSRWVNFSHTFDAAGRYLVSLRASAENDFRFINNSRWALVFVDEAREENRAENDDDADGSGDEDDGTDDDGADDEKEDGQTDEEKNPDGRDPDEKDPDEKDEETGKTDDNTGYTDNRAPASPTPVSPADGATGVSLAPALRAGDFFDRDGDGHAASQWQISRDASFSDRVLSAESQTHLTELPVPRLVLLAGTTYFWRTRHRDDRDATSPWSEPVAFTTEYQRLDQNRDGIHDEHAWLQYSDLDDNGISDMDQADMACGVPVVDKTLVVCIKCPASGGRIEYLEMIDPAMIHTEEGKPEHLPAGLLNFRIRMPAPAQTARLEVFFSNPAAEAPRWISYNTIDGWQDFSDHAAFRKNRRSVAIEIKDGGFGDADGVSNGVIVDPSGIATTAFTTAGADSDGDDADGQDRQWRWHVGCFIYSLRQ